MGKLQENIEIKTYQCNEFGSMKLRHLFDCFQELASDHADKLGLGYEECLKKNCAWVCAKYHVLIDRLPKFKDKITIQTWPSKFVGPTGIREFLVKDENDNVLIKAVSQWVIIDLVRFRPLIAQNVFDCASLAEGDEVGLSLDKIAPMTENNFIKKESLRYDDVDVNHHINNAVYIALLEDVLFEKFGQDVKVKEISVDFKKSAVLSDKEVLIKSLFDENIADFTVSKGDDTVDFARVNMVIEK